MNKGTRTHLQTDPVAAAVLQEGCLAETICLNIIKMASTGRHEVCQPLGSLALGFANIWLQPLKYGEFKNGASTLSLRILQT